MCNSLINNTEGYVGEPYDGEGYAAPVDDDFHIDTGRRRRGVRVYGAVRFGASVFPDVPYRPFAVEPATGAGGRLRRHFPRGFGE